MVKEARSCIEVDESQLAPLARVIRVDFRRRDSGLTCRHDVGAESCASCARAA